MLTDLLLSNKLIQVLRDQYLMVIPIARLVSNDVNQIRMNGNTRCKWTSSNRTMIFQDRKRRDSEYGSNWSIF